MRFLVVGQSSSNIRQRLEQTLEASPRLDPAQENLALWLGRMEKELPLLDSQLGEKSNLISAADRERVRLGQAGREPSASGQEGHPSKLALGFLP